MGQSRITNPKSKIQNLPMAQWPDGPLALSLLLLKVWDSSYTDFVDSVLLNGK
jgi:hypothetical protein